VSYDFERITKRLYPEFVLGGFARCDERLTFFNRVNALLRADMIVLDFGAGRGYVYELDGSYRSTVTQLKGKCRRFIGADIDPAVLENTVVDSALLIGPDGKILTTDLRGEKLKAAVAAALGRPLAPRGPSTR